MKTDAIHDRVRHDATCHQATESRPQRFLTIQEVCNLLNLGRTTVWRLMNQHGLKSVRIGGARRIRETDLETWLEKHSTGPNNSA